MTKNSHFYPVILAGGSGTRFWPRSRRKMAKQVLNLDGDQSMIQQTVARLLPLADENNFWTITNDHIFEVISGQLKKLPKRQIVSEPVARNTAPAIGLAAFILQRSDPEAVIGMFPADHVIQDEKSFRKVVSEATELAQAGDNMVVMGITPNRPETGYGYIEAGEKLGEGLYRVRRFTEKPNQQRADEFVTAGNYYWNSGIFVWSAKTLVNAIREHLSETAPYLEQIAAAWGTSKFQSIFAHLYEKCENISIDYAVLEPRSAKGEHSSNLYCLRADFGWNDLGSWTALFEHQLSQARNGGSSNVIDAEDHFILNADGNYVYSPKKFVAAVGVKNIVVVETEDAILVTTREHSQDVAKVVKHLADKKLTKLI
jgi:mannose-1-phosphate guanylyltransferase